METKQVEQLKLNVTNIKSFLVSSNKETKKINAQKSSLIRTQEQAEKRKLKEKSLESVPGSGTAKNIFSQVTSPVTSFFDKILNFAGSILLGVIVNNLPAIIEKAQEVINVVKPLWEGAVKTIGFIFNTSKTIFESVVSFFNPKKVESETQEVTVELNSLEKELDFDENILGNLGPLPDEEGVELEQVDDATEDVSEPVKTIIPVIPFNPPEPQKRNEGGEIIRTTQPNQSPPKSSRNATHPFERLYNNVHMNRDTLELYRKNIDKYEKINEKLKGINLGGGAPTNGGPPSSPDQTPVPVNVGPIKPGGMLDKMLVVKRLVVGKLLVVF
jgi:hypothetical protein